MKEVILLSTHFVNNFILDNYISLREQLDENKYDVILLVNLEKEFLSYVPKTIKVYRTDSDSINQLGYNPIEETLLPGSCHFPVLRFFLDNPNYKFYWFVEYDVVFTGNWATLMDDCDRNLLDYDFLSCQMEKFDYEKNRIWPWWYRSNYLPYDLNDCVKAFNPICRYSEKALAYLDSFQKKGFSAHSEVLISTSLYHAGYKIGDFGGHGEFVPQGYERKFYIPDKKDINGGTMRYRPVYTMDEILKLNLPNKLFHPLKSY